MGKCNQLLALLAHIPYNLLRTTSNFSNPATHIYSDCCNKEPSTTKINLFTVELHAFTLKLNSFNLQKRAPFQMTTSCAEVA